MSRRAWVIVGVVAAVVVGSLAAVYLTGLIIVGDPYSGVWNVEGRWTSAGPNGGYLIKRTDDGYVFTALVGDELVGWRPLQQDGRTLTGEWDGTRFIFKYQPWTGHLVWTYWEHDILRVPSLPLRKATDDTSVPKQVD
jgi:hypothetical protein